MASAKEWLKSRALFPRLFPDPPDPLTGIIIVVPAFDEPGITTLLDSLASCSKPECATEVIIIVNAPVNAGHQSLLNNEICIQEISAWNKANQSSFLKILAYDTGQPLIKGWGAGLARKAGMDEALRRFSIIDKPDGIIVSLDADCTVGKDYLKEIYSKLQPGSKENACSIWFEHPLAGNEFPDQVYRYVSKYELHMRYFLQAVRYTGFPYAFHTIGSAIACKADAYLRSGGMNRRQAGEDFYFIQKLVPLGGFFELNTTTVYPSPRISSRVPFGTGPVISKMIAEKTDLFLTYCPQAFFELRKVFLALGEIYSPGGIEDKAFYDTLPESVKSFITSQEWSEKIMEIRENTSNEDSFRKRFCNWFNMFRIVKYLNHVHSALFTKIPVEDAASSFLTLTGRSHDSEDTVSLLRRYRTIEKSS